MGKNTSIEWTDHSFSPWLGCEKIRPACANCYAAGWAKRAGRPELWNGERMRTSDAYWQQPLKWHKAIPEGQTQTVFSAQLADVFDNKATPAWRDDFWELIRATPRLTWLLLSKRIGNAPRMLPPDWGDGYPNVYLGSTIGDRKDLEHDAAKLKAIPARVHFWSAEPLLEDLGLIPQDLLPEWVICGFESGPKARPPHPDLARNLRDQCVTAGVPFLFKQWGEWWPYCQMPHGWLDERFETFSHEDWGIRDRRVNRFLDSHAVVTYPDGAESLTHQQSIETPNAFRAGAMTCLKVGTKVSGRLLDGMLWDEYPRERAAA